MMIRKLSLSWKYNIVPFIVLALCACVYNPPIVIIGNECSKKRARKNWRRD